MNSRAFGRRDELIVMVVLAVPLLAGFFRGLLPDAIIDAVRFGLLPVTFLGHELQTSVIWGGVEGLESVLFPTFRAGTVPLVWDVISIVLVSYLVAFVSVRVGERLVSVSTTLPDNPLLKPTVGTIVTVGVISLVGNTTKMLTADPVQGQIFHPQAVAGALTLVLLVVVVLGQRTSVP